MERTEIDGVTVLWQQGPAPLQARLAFGVGERDETFRTLGVTHLVEHLTMSRLPKVHHDRNASVDLDTTDFTATGRPDQIVAFLHDVCRALADLPYQRMATEAGVLEAEGGACTHPTAAALLGRRFGYAGPGLAPWAGPGYDRIDEDMVRAHAARYFVAGNAVLTLTGPPPQGLTLPLPPGARQPHAAPDPLPRPGPIWATGPVPSVGIALSGAPTVDWSMAIWVLMERLQDRARHERGISYDVDSMRARVDADRSEHMLMVDARDGQEAEVAAIVWDEVQKIAATGPTVEELEHECAGFREQLNDPRFIADHLASRADRVLFGLPDESADQRLAEAERLTAAEVAAVVAAALPTAVIIVPPEVELDLPGVSLGGCWGGKQRPAGTVFRPSAFARLRYREARTAALILTADGVAMVDSDGDVHTVPFAEVVGVLMRDDSRVMFGGPGCVIEVDPDMYAGVRPLVEAIDRAVPAHLRFEASALRS